MIFYDGNYWTLVGNMVIILAAATMLLFLARWSATRLLPDYREPITGISLAAAGIFLRIGPWVYGLATANDCDVSSGLIGCTYNPLIIEMKPYFTLISALLTAWGFLKFIRWVERWSIKVKLMWAGGIISSAVALSAFFVM